MHIDYAFIIFPQAALALNAKIISASLTIDSMRTYIKSAE
jgi:hypothetical protein